MISAHFAERSSVNSMHVPFENEIRTTSDLSVRETINCAPSIGRMLGTPVSSSVNNNHEASSDETRTLSSRAVTPFSPQVDDVSLTLVLSQFFSISGPSSDDMSFLLHARRFGMSDAKQHARNLGWHCAQAIRAVEHMAK
jgi:hypothetical protein